MKILLDIDGVMLPLKSWKVPDFLEDGFMKFDTKAIYVLNNILEKTNAKIILTTSHKSNYTNEQWIILFKNRNIDAVIETLPKNVDNLSRKDEIINYLDSNLDDYLIIDDDSQLNTLPSHIKEKLILTSPLIGLVEEHIVKILKILS